MPFELVPVFEKMEAIYQLPYGRRFEKYLYLLQEGNKDELKLPIAGYNPMGKPAVLEKLQELMALDAEGIATKELAAINQTLANQAEATIQVVLNLADDLGGAWTNFYTTDYTTKFQISPLVNRHFCTPYFWTSEQTTEAVIRQRVRAAAFRTLHHLENDAPLTLAEHLANEVFVQSKLSTASETHQKNFSEIAAFYSTHQASADYNLIFNFFYGDEASELMGFKTYGRAPKEGFAYAQFLASE
ncbi:MAG: hypothetical protein Sapg2KO_51870 [Saprospiraceae bacterium]